RVVPLPPPTPVPTPASDPAGVEGLGGAVRNDTVGVGVAGDRGVAICPCRAPREGHPPPVQPPVGVSGATCRGDGGWVGCRMRRGAGRVAGLPPPTNHTRQGAGVQPATGGEVVG